MAISYHTDVKLAASLGILPDAVASKIPRSTLYRFKTSDFSSVFGLPDSPQIPELTKLAKEFVKSKTAVQLFKKALYLRDTMISLLKKAKQTKTQVKRTIVKAITKVKGSLGLDRAVRFFSITKATFYAWKNLLLHPCDDSPLSRCVKIWPNQLSKKEVNTMKSLLRLSQKYTISEFSMVQARGKIYREGTIGWHDIRRII